MSYSGPNGREPHAAVCVGCQRPFRTMATRRNGMACSLECRLAAGVEKRGPDECWPWRNFVESDGYGRFVFQKKRVRSHRVAYELAKGAVPEGLVVMHSCDNPVCCNPAHLSVGTSQENTADKIAKGRGNAPKGEAVGSAKLTDDAVRFIRSSPMRVPDLARRFGVHPQCIYKVRQRIRWKHVTDHA